MAYSKEHKEQIIKDILSDISNGMSLVKSCKKSKIKRSTFYEWGVHESDNYARACEERAMIIFEDALEISDNEQGDVSRDKLKIDTRKWFLSKMIPSKYGDKQYIDHTTGGDKFEPPKITFNE